ncbi:hypothetical protein SRABI118_04610 [Massilia sp. Bi118]|uniref:TorF family putative porin n=1 Tax=Massilia sp. Bi118 TaxID=2822346 RepID=UPI001D4290EB|nr:TorF family putative porin [Massilia sp. Bi118]CAH0306758.1 hypothetical protein SRABI118_04610 [Massilia sp. Bi118]
MHPALRLAPCAALLLAAVMPLAHAADVAPSTGPYAAAIESALAPAPLSARVTVASQYVSRGIRQSWGRPALQAGIDYVRPDGWRAGAWTSTVDDRFIDNGSLEMDVYAGYSRTVGDLGYSARATWYHYPGARVPGSSIGFDYGELAAGLSWKAVYARYNYTFTRDFFGVADARGTGYLDLGARHEFGPGLLLKLHAGDGRVAGAGNGVWNWRDLAAGLSTRLEGGWLVALNLTRAIGGAAAPASTTATAPATCGPMAGPGPPVPAAARWC